MTISKAAGMYLKSDNPSFYGPEFLRFIASSSFEGKDAENIGIIEVYGKYFHEEGELKFEVPTGSGSHIYAASQVYDDKLMAERRYTIDAVRKVREYHEKIGILLAQLK